MAKTKVEVKPVIVTPVVTPPVVPVVAPAAVVTPVVEKPKGKEVKCHRCGTLMVLLKSVENETVFQCPQCSAKISFTR